MTFTLATRASASDPFKVFQKIPVELSPEGEFTLPFELIPSSVLNTDSRACNARNSGAPVVEVSYAAEGYISQSKRLALFAKELDVGEHSPVPASAENRLLYAKLNELRQTSDTSVALRLLSRIKVAASNPFAPVVETLKLMLKLKRGVIDELSRTAEAKDRFWGADCEGFSPFRFFTWPDRLAVGPFEVREYSRSEIVALASKFTTAPFLELAKTLFLAGYRENVSDLPDSYGRIYENLPVSRKALKEHAFALPQPAIFDREEFLATMLEDFGAIGPRRLGDVNARRRFEASLRRVLPATHDLRKEAFSHRHSKHGTITLTNFLAEPNYPHNAKVLLATHYDSFSGTYDPGANNGLSGVFALSLVLGDTLFMNWAVENRIGVYVHFYDGETAGEPGLKSEYFLGSVFHAENSRENRFDYVICADMTGVDLIYDRIYASVDRNLMQGLLDIAYALGARMGERLQITDDHYVYHRQGIPAALLIRYRYPH